MSGGDAACIKVIRRLRYSRPRAYTHTHVVLVVSVAGRPLCGWAAVKGLAVRNRARGVPEDSPPDARRLCLRGSSVVSDGGRLTACRDVRPSARPALRGSSAFPLILMPNRSRRGFAPGSHGLAPAARCVKKISPDARRRRRIMSRRLGRPRSAVCMRVRSHRPAAHAACLILQLHVTFKCGQRRTLGSTFSDKRPSVHDRIRRYNSARFPTDSVVYECAHDNSRLLYTEML